MEYPSSGPGGQLRFPGEGETGSVAEPPWDPADSDLLQSLFNRPPDSDHHVHPVANPGAGLPASIPTCRSQAVRAGPRVRPAIDLISHPFSDADPRWPAPVTAQQ